MFSDNQLDADAVHDAGEVAVIDAGVAAFVTSRNVVAAESHQQFPDIADPAVGTIRTLPIWNPFVNVRAVQPDGSDNDHSPVPYVVVVPIWMRQVRNPVVPIRR